MSVSRIAKLWIRPPTARSRPLRRTRPMALEPLESRMALAGGPDLSVATAPAEIGFASASPRADEWAMRWDAKQDGSPQATAGNADTGTPFATAHGSSSLVTIRSDSPFLAIRADGSNVTARADSSYQAAHADASSSSSDGAVPAAKVDTAVPGVSIDGVTPLPASTPDDGGESSASDPSSSPAQGGSGGGTNTPPNVEGSLAGPEPTDPTGQIFQTADNQDDFNPGLLDPLAWTVTEDQPFADGAESGDAEEPLLLTGTAGVAGPSTLMDRPDETAIGGASGYRSAVGWRADSFALSQPGDEQIQGLRDPLAIGPRDDSIAEGTTPWRRFLNGSALREETGLNDREHIAELSPLAGSPALALAATLWSAPTRFQTGLEAEKTCSAAKKGSLDIEPSTPSWKVFVMGLDRAIERSCGEVRRGLSADTGAPGQRVQADDSAGLRLEWRGAIVPTAAPPVRESSTDPSECGGGSPAAEATGSFVPAVIELGEFLLENLLNPVFGHEHGGNRNSQ
jgi:hypothetical protein